ncbi:glycoside hydrolase family 73 protein [Paenibacillus radicis (ex Xue et al. 2023)]|uniref:Glucosaminidase domain-containing protein n=1 Tax=Paenibacillus radicis (ex Xue et al. 2023) TaxID=2972489 RepID=A0ABT1YSN1_9BACL|nr:glucosaminidase domain-containing protein [Paenibacillus radicis (ex Xue et al. 2023)]MCR8636197.1 glucosaminidase domain-containing protein [Paenibacillus radicis (ex Xue et al. 2023)]
MNPQQFINTLAPTAVAEMHRTRILASITIAQGALESGWGAYAPGNNLFGIKGSGQLQETKEFINGHWADVVDGFRVYDDWIGSVIDHSQFLMENGRYAKAGFFEHCTAKNYKEAAYSLQKAGYATDPSYASKLISIVQSWDLEQYDRITLKELDAYMLTAQDANKVIGFLKAAYEATTNPEAQAEFHHLANELRKASGQPEE